jgi:hypothetical protein
MAINATVIICEDLRIENTGKVIVIGMHPGNLSIPTEGETTIAQLIFLFSIDGPLSYLPNRVRFEVEIPGVSQPLSSEMSMETQTFEEKYTRWSARQAIGMRNITAQSGKIAARVWVDDQQLEVSSPWIVAAEPTLSSPTTA